MNKETFRMLRQMLMEELDLSRELSDKEILDVIDELILNQMQEVRLALKEKVQLRQELFYSVRKLDVLQELIDDETVTEIMVNGPETIFVERNGKLMKWHKTFTSREKLEDVIQQIVGKCNRVVNESMPIVDARLENGSRVNAVIYPVALNGPILTIRRFPEHPISMEKLIALGSITQECTEFLQKLVKARYSMVIGGGTGSGKTTVVNLLMRFYDVDSGEILIDDVNIKDIDCATLRKNTAIVLQDTVLFADTIKNNLKYSNEAATDEQMYAAAAMSNCDTMINKMPLKYDTELMAEGENISQGQRQLLAIARAAVADPPVLILDEATSSVDTRTEALIERGMDQLMEGRTVFVIAHRLSTVRNSNAIMVLEQGKIVERGDHDDLLEQKGKYYQLYHGMFELS